MGYGDPIKPCPSGQKACPWCGGQPSFREQYYRGTGSSGMEAPTLSIGCATDDFWFPYVATDKYQSGKGYTDLRDQAERDQLEKWNRQL